jgi:hypothetical protein
MISRNPGRTIAGDLAVLPAHRAEAAAAAEPVRYILLCHQDRESA